MIDHHILAGNRVVTVSREEANAWLDASFEHDAGEHCIGIGPRQVARSQDPYVSTVFTDNRGFADGRWLYFESLWYEPGKDGGEGGDATEHMRLYATHADAVRGHGEIVAALVAGQDPEAALTVGTSNPWGDEEDGQ